jgi:hypothetical protein
LLTGSHRKLTVSMGGFGRALPLSLRSGRPFRSFLAEAAAETIRRRSCFVIEWALESPAGINSPDEAGNELQSA